MNQFSQFKFGGIQLSHAEEQPQPNKNKEIEYRVKDYLSRINSLNTQLSDKEKEVNFFNQTKPNLSVQTSNSWRWAQASRIKREKIRILYERVIFLKEWK